MIDLEPLTISELKTVFTPEKGWNVVEIPDSRVDRRTTVPGSEIRCIDRRYGLTPHGYDPNIIPLGPAWLGGLDGIAAFAQGNAEQRMLAAIETIRAFGFVGHVHGDLVDKDLGCGFRRALVEEKVPDLDRIILGDWRELIGRLNVPYTQLHPSNKHAEGFLFNQRPLTTCFPQDCTYYPVDFAFARTVGIDIEKGLSLVEKCGQLLLHGQEHTLFVISD